MKRMIAGLVLALVLTGCGSKVAEVVSVPKAEAGQVAQAEGSAKVHLCGAMTKAGRPCRNRVKAEGLRCHLHGGKQAVNVVD